MRRMAIGLLGVALVLAVAATSAIADIVWDWTLIPTYVEAPPGGSMTFDFTVTNSGASTENLSMKEVGTGGSFWGQAVDEAGPEWVKNLPPGTTSPVGLLDRFRWRNDTPVGFTGTVFFNVYLTNGDVIRKDATAYCTPELPPGALGLLSFVPYGLWRLRRRRV